MAYLVYGAFLYMTAGGAPQQMDRGKSAMMTALSGVVLALLAFVIVEVGNGRRR